MTTNLGTNKYLRRMSVLVLLLLLIEAVEFSSLFCICPETILSLKNTTLSLQQSIESSAGRFVLSNFTHESSILEPLKKGCKFPDDTHYFTIRNTRRSTMNLRLDNDNHLYGQTLLSQFISPSIGYPQIAFPSKRNDTPRVSLYSLRTVVLIS